MSQELDKITLQSIQSLRFFYWILVGGLIISLMLVFLFRDQIHLQGALPKNIFWTAIVGTIVSVIVNPMVFFGILKKAKGESMIQRLKTYRLAAISRYFILYMASMMNIVFLFLTQNLIYGYIFAAAFMSLLLLKPSLAKVYADLDLTKEQNSNLN